MPNNRSNSGKVARFRRSDHDGVHSTS
jgi:hypothetical protein